MPARPLNVVYLRDHLVPSGGTSYLRNTLPRFDARRIRASLCVLQPRDGSAAWFEASGVPVFFAGRSKLDPRHLLEVGAWLRAREPDLVVLSGPKSMVVGGLLARTLGLPMSPRFNNMIKTSKPLDWGLRRLLSNAPVAVAVSRAVQDWACARYGLPRERIEVVHPGHDTARFGALAGAREAIRAELGIAADAPIIALVGRLRAAEKGQDLMIQAVPEVLHRHPDAVLLLAGAGPDGGRLETLVQNLGLARSVRLLGHRDDVAELMAAADVIVIPSVCDEAFGLTALEGWAAGRPVVAFASGGLAELLQHGETGLVVPKGDMARLVDAILQVLNDPSLAARLTAAGRQLVAHFTVESHIRTLSDLYARIASGA